MKRAHRLPSEVWKRQKKFNAEIKAERVGKFIKDHRGRIYKVESDGSVRKATLEDLKNYGEIQGRGDASEGDMRGSSSES